MLVNLLPDSGLGLVQTILNDSVQENQQHRADIKEQSDYLYERGGGKISQRRRLASFLWNRA
jgi:hypothetical protein